MREREWDVSQRVEGRMEGKERKERKKIKVQRGWGNCLRSHSKTELPGSGSTEPFLKDKGHKSQRWSWMAELGDREDEAIVIGY